MGCPQCNSDEISPSGVCLICGFRISEDSSEPKTESGEGDAPGYSGMIEMNYAEGTPEPVEKAEIPEWRQQLSQRLQEIKQKREAVAATPPETKTPPPEVQQARAAESLSALQAKLLEKKPVRKSPSPFVPPPRQITLQPLEPELPAPPALPPADPQEIRNLIDNAVSRQVSQDAAPAGVAEIIQNEPETVFDQEGKLILLSRTLSGLVDLIIIVLCTGVFILAADYFSGIIALDRISLLIFSVLFLLNYFLYSLFFLSASNQTIGMMITDLHLVGRGEKRPTMGQLLRRCCGYLVSLFGLGIGLLSGLFDRGSLCFHDHVSGTYVARG